MIESLTDAAFYLFFAALWLWATASLRGWPWRVVLGFKALEQLDWVVLHCFRAIRGFTWAPRIPSMHLLGLMGTIHIGLILSVVIAAAADRTTKTRRDWLHHLATIAMVAESLQFLFGGFGAYLVRWWSSIWFHLVG